MAERRSSARVNIEAKLHSAGGQMVTSDSIRNVSLGGVFIEMSEPLPFGAELDIEFSLAVSPRVVRCRGFVVWSSKTHPERCLGQQGIGVRLMDIGITEMRILNDVIAGKLGA